MNKSPVAGIAMLLTAAIALASSAQAGFGVRIGFGGPLPMFAGHGSSYSSEHPSYRKRYVERRVKKKEKTHVAKRSKPSAKNGNVEPKAASKDKGAPVSEATAAKPAEPDAVVDSENSTMTGSVASEPRADGQPTPESAAVQAASAQPPLPEPKPTKAASKLDCKKFFPSAGITLTVPCE